MGAKPTHLGYRNWRNTHVKAFAVFRSCAVGIACVEQSGWAGQNCHSRGLLFKSQLLAFDSQVVVEVYAILRVNEIWGRERAVRRASTVNLHI